MAQLDKNSISFACRACLQLNEACSNIYTVELFSEVLKQKVCVKEVLEKYTSIRVSENDEKPQKMCQKCVDRMFQSFDFFELCEESNRTLEVILQNKNNSYDDDHDPLDLCFENVDVLIKEESDNLLERSPEKGASLCPMCNKSFKNVSGHLRITHLLDVEKQNKCLKCNIELPNAGNLDYSEHLESEEHQSLFCIHCNKKFVTVKSCYKHQVICKTKESCKICEKSFTSFEDAFQHFNEDHKSDKTCIFGCKKTYISWKYLQYHIQVSHGNKIGCKKCLAAFSTKYEFREHNKSNEHKNVCDICNRRFDKKQRYKIHMESHQAYKHKCEKCGITYLRITNLKRHIERDHDGYRFLCQECGKSFTLKFNLDEHMKTVHGGIKKQICSVCGVALTGIENINEHKKLHESGEIVCFKCKKKFESNEELEIHLQLHKQLACDVCGDNFIYQFQLKKHKKKDHPSPDKNKLSTLRGVRKFDPNKYKHCARCDKNFENPHDYFMHAKAHKEFQCHLCDKSYSNQYLLKYHIKTHTEGYRFKCDYCGRGFLMKVALEKHIWIHTGQKPFLCNVCGKEFRQKSHLIGHMNSHTGVKSYKCRYCQKMFVHHSSWVCHERIHTGERPYICSICSKAFYHSSTMKKHEATHSAPGKLFLKHEDASTH